MVAATTVTKGTRRQFQSVFSKVWVVTAAVDPLTLDTSEANEVNITGVTGVAVGDIVLFGSGVDNALVSVTAAVTAADTVTLTFVGVDDDVNLLTSTWNIVVLRVDPNLKVSG